MKKKYYLVLDVETANSLDDAMCYDVGFVVCDRKGRIYESASYVVEEVFYDRHLMNSAYYKNKLPLYRRNIKNKVSQVATLYEVRGHIRALMDAYEIKTVCAYNAHFDRNALNKTQRWLTKSKYRYFFPYGTEILCIWHAACQLICTQKKYYKFCVENGLVSKSGNISTNAESVYRYITRNNDFEEEHTGLADVLIETQILAHCFRQHKKFDPSINRLCWRIPQRKD